MKILVCNDDGICSPGLIALAQIASQFGEVTVFAPEVEQSAVGHAITIKRPLEYHPADVDGIEAYRVNGSPADCVALGLYHMGTADLVLSGINLGLNLGRDLWHSGTVAVTRQAEFYGIQSIAFSKVRSIGKPTYENQKPYIAEIINMLLQSHQPKLVNVNLPETPVGMLWTHQTLQYYNHKIVKSEDPDNHNQYWFVENPTTAPDKGSDRWAIDNHLVSLTPISQNMTDEDWLIRLNKSI